MGSRERVTSGEGVDDGDARWGGFAEVEALSAYR